MKQRLITGIFIVLATVLAIVAKLIPHNVGDYIFDVFALTIALVSSMEMCNIMEKRGKKISKLLTSMYAIFNYVVLIISLEFAAFKWLLLIEICALAVYFAVILIWEFVAGKDATFKAATRVALNSIFACAYPAFMFCLITIINHADVYSIKGFSMVFIIAIFAITYLTDTFAYLVGRTFKGPKLAPKISPNKTISGAIGGLLGGIAAAMLVFLMVCKISSWSALLDLYSLSWWHFLILGAVASAIGQCGDLFESSLKRKAGIKDSGNLFPGHGGMLDRYDAMTFVTTFVFIFVFIILI